MSLKPYRSTSVFDEVSLPQALRRDHSTKAGVWGAVVVLEGKLRLQFEDGRNEILEPGKPGRLNPLEVHWVDPIGKMKMRVDFYNCEPQVRRN